MEQDSADPAEACLLLLCGLPGAGKTTLALHLVREASREGIEVRHVCFDELGCQPSSGNIGGEAAAAFSPEAWRFARQAALAQLQLQLNSSSGSESSSSSSSVECRQPQQPMPACGQLALSDCREQAGATGSRAAPSQQNGAVQQPHRQRRLVIADDNLQYRSLRWQCYGLARAAGAAVVVLHLLCSEQLAQQRNAQRPPSKRVPPAVISRMAAQFEAPGSSSSGGGGGGTGDGSSRCCSIAAWERSCSVECTAEQPIDVAEVFQQVRSKWGAPAPPPFDAEAAAAERAAAQAATAASRAHGVDVATRQVLSLTMQRLVHVAPTSKAATAQQLNAARRQLLQQAAAEQPATAEEPEASAERWAAVYQGLCDSILASVS